MPAPFTPRALAALRDLLHATDRQPGQLIRMVTDIHGGFHLTLSERRPSDHVISCGSEEILVIEARASNHIGEHHPGGVIDVQQGPDGPTLVMTHPDGKAAPAEHRHGG